MDSQKIVTRRSILAKGFAASVVAMGLGTFLRPGSTMAVDTTRPSTTQAADTTCKVLCDDDGKNCKRCCYDRYGYPMGCEPVSGSTRLPR